MSKNRTDLVEGQRLPQDFVDSLQEFLGAQASPNFTVIIVNPTTLRVPAGADNAQVAIAINGRWRYITANADAAAPGGLTVGDNPIFVAASVNVFATNPTPPPTESDTTDYTFRLLVLPVGTTPTGTGTQALYRQVGVATWSGTAFTDVRLTTLSAPPQKHAASHNPGGPDALDYHGSIHIRGTLAARPAYSATYAGVLYYATDVNGGTLYRGSSTLVAWEAITIGLTSPPAPHETTHLPGASDALPWTTVHGYGTLAARPTAASTNTGFLYYATDTSTIYRSNGTSWDSESASASSLNQAGTLAALPGAGTVSAGTTYLATDDHGGTKYRSNGTTWVKESPAVNGEWPLGAVAEWPWASGSIPAYTVLPYGQLLTQAAFPDMQVLADAAGRPFGGVAATNFNTPDYRGRVGVGKDDMGGTAANRITVAVSGVSGATLGAVFGAEGITLTTGQLPAHNHGVTGAPGFSDPNHVHGAPTVTARNNGLSTTVGSSAVVTDANVDTTNFSLPGAAVPAHSTGITTGVGTLGTANAGSGSAHQNTQPSIIVNKLMRVL